VKTGTDEWRAMSENGEIIVVNTLIEIIRIDGTKAIVKPFKKEG
jgi:membrane protein implicated in regulation of membrane protease activity